ncbi:hypothetical protein HMPREF3192_01223 [Atopobium deltae]|uniref:Uncharacterized protein n=1 Tax=Atopobium deltae TaxID=1393034 RepID=A0A133XQQ2_9ACTN|nr:hypothetical protein HMPREF3192_01223 [Atopobium deltae]
MAIKQLKGQKRSKAHRSFEKSERYRGTCDKPTHDRNVYDAHVCGKDAETFCQGLLGQMIKFGIVGVVATFVDLIGNRT